MIKQLTRAAAFSVAIAGILSVGMNIRTVSASDRASVSKPVAVNVIPPNCSPGRGGCGIFD